MFVLRLVEFFEACVTAPCSGRTDFATERMSAGE
jgi:hypothetical protein